MTPSLLYSITGMLLFSLGLFGVVSLNHLLRKILALSIMASGVFLFLISVAARNSAASPDPVPQAMLLTGVVVSLSAMAFAVALARRILAATGRAQLEESGK